MTRTEIINKIVQAIDRGITPGYDGSSPSLSWNARKELPKLLNKLCDEIVREAIEP